MAEHATTAGKLRCVVVTPETTLIDTECDFVALPLADGEIGIAPGRSPLIGRLGFGELRIRIGDRQQRFYADGGFVQVVHNEVNVLTNRAVAAATIDKTAAAEQLTAAIARKAAGSEELAIRDRLVAQARGQLRVAATGA